MGACGENDGDDTELTGPPATQDQGAAPPTTNAAAPPPTAPADTTMPTDPTIVFDSVPSSTSPSGRSATESAVADLAARKDVNPADVRVVSAESVTWPDTSLGCPRKEMGYLQVLTDGVLVVLELDGTRYEYHGDATNPPTYCADPKPPVQG